MGFQTQVGVQPAPAIAGDFADHNPRVAVAAGPGGLVAGALGLTIGRFAWWNANQIDADNAPTLANNFGAGPITGFVSREQRALITTYLADSGMVIPAGFPVTLMSAGGYWVKNDGATQALPGQFAYASFADGKASFAAAGAPNTASVTGSVAASTASVTGSIANDVLTVTAVGSGVLVPGGTLSGTGVASGTKILSQLSGTAGGIGTYAVNIPEQTVASTTISETYGTMTVSAVGSGVLGVGDSLSGTNVVAGTTVTALGTGTGGTGTYIVDNNTVVASTTITAGLNVQTKFVAMTAGLPGELVKISSHVLG
ncbi:MAG: hypothetical protein JWQ97_3731 [Phenylobacterium sp.]|nr:hypothetical protein [Phenylobacterium sp.]